MARTPRQLPSAEGGCDGSRGQGRRLANARLAVGADRAAAAGAAAAPVGLPQPAGARPGRDGRDPVRAQDGLPVERAQRDRDLLLELGAPPLPGVARGGRVRGAVAARPARLRRAGRDRVGVAGDGRGDDQGAAGRRQDWPEPDRSGEKGAKRSLLTEGKGIPLGIADEGANRNDFKLSRQTLESIPIERPQPTEENPQNLCLDKGYDYDEVRELSREFGFTAHIRSRGEEKKRLAREAGFRARRWVVERTHSRLNRCHALLIRWSKKPENHLALLHLACALISWKAVIA